MGGKKYFLMIVIIIISGFAGGIFSDRFLSIKAQATDDGRKIFTGRAFHLVDEKGNVRGGLGFSKDGCPSVLFKNPSGKPIAYFAVVDSTPIIEFMNEEAEKRLSISLGQGGNPHIFFTDNNKKLKMGILIDNNGHPGILLCDTENVPRLALSVQDKSPRIAFMEGKKNLDMLISTEENGNSGMIIQNQHGKLALGLINNNPTLMLDKTPDTGLVSGFGPDGTPLMALRENRHVTWVAPDGKRAEVQSIDPAADWQSITDTLLTQPKF